MTFASLILINIPTKSFSTVWSADSDGHVQVGNGNPAMFNHICGSLAP
jgi:hypothetical protein